MLSVSPIPAYKDNYIWLIRDRDARAAVVDPGEAAPVLRRLAAEGLTLTAILITHRHWDHVNGVEELVERFPVPVYGPAGEPVAGMTDPVRQGDRVEILGETLEVLDIPGHTVGHVAYHGGGMLFCGDTLFAGGCGRIFEGTPRQMHDSLSRLAALPPRTRVYCGHEYTLANLRFALQVEPDNADLRARCQAVAAQRERGEVTLPSTLAEELRTNPFLRADQGSVKRGAESHSGKALSSPVDVFAAVREWKNAAG